MPSDDKEQRDRGGFLAELRERQVIQTLVIYVAVGWGFYEIAKEYLVELFGLPDDAHRALLVLLLLGLPAVLFLAWYFDVDRKGVRAEERIRRSDWVVIAVAVAIPAAGTWGYAEYFQPLPVPADSIAVLPFEDLSSGQDKDFLAHGLAIEVWNRLLRVPDLKIAHRDSSFAPEIRGLDLRGTARALDSRYLLSGDLRLEGDRLRVTATLTDIAGKTVIWSHAYDRLLVDIFSVQDDIATAIVDATTGPGTGALFIKPGYRPDASMDAYFEYLKFITHHVGDDAEAINDLKGLVADNEGFVEGYVMLARECANASIVFQEPPDGHYTRCAWDAARRAVDLNEKLSPEFRTAAPHLALSVAYRGDWDYIAAREENDKAIEAMPGDPSAREELAWLLGETGRFEESIDVTRELVANWGTELQQWYLVWVYIEAGLLQDASDLLKPWMFAMDDDGTPTTGMEFPDFSVGLLWLELGDLQKAIHYLPNGLAGIGYPRDLAIAEIELRLGRMSESDYLALLDRMIANGDVNEAVALNFMAAYGMADEFYRRAAKFIPTRQLLHNFLWRYEARAIREDPRFEDLVGKLGIIPYWDRYGWPDVCERTGEEFECHPIPPAWEARELQNNALRARYSD